MIFAKEIHYSRRHHFSQTKRSLALKIHRKLYSPPNKINSSSVRNLMFQFVFLRVACKWKQPDVTDHILLIPIIRPSSKLFTEQKLIPHFRKNRIVVQLRISFFSWNFNSSEKKEFILFTSIVK